MFTYVGETQLLQEVLCVSVVGVVAMVIVRDLGSLLRQEDCCPVARDGSCSFSCVLMDTDRFLLPGKLGQRW